MNRVCLFSIYLIVGVLLYQPSIFFDKFIFDDDHYIFKNPLLMGSTFSSIIQIVTSFKTPIPNLIWSLTSNFKLEHQQIILHLINIIFHSLNSIIIYKLLEQLVKTKHISDLKYLPAFVAGTFLIFPVNVETAVWLSGLRGVLSLFFSLLCVLNHLKWREKNQKYYSLNTVLYLIFALLSKQDAISLPIIIILIDLMLYKIKIKYVFAFSLVLLSISATYSFFQLKSIHELGSNEIGVQNRLFLSFHAYSYYINHFLFPFNTVFGGAKSFLDRSLYNINSIDFILRMTFFVGIFKISTVLKNKKILKNYFSVFAFIVTLLPFSGLIPFPFQAISVTSSRYMYFGSVSYSFMLVWALFKIRDKKVRDGLLIAFGITFLFTTIFNINRWQKDSTILQAILNKNPENYHVRVSLITAHMKEKNYIKVKNNVSFYLNHPNEIRKNKMFEYYAEIIDKCDDKFQKEEFLKFYKDNPLKFHNETLDTVLKIAIDTNDTILSQYLVDKLEDEFIIKDETRHKINYQKTRLVAITNKNLFKYNYKLGEYYFHKKDYDKAYSHYKDAKKHRSFSDPVLDNYERLKSFFGD